RTWGSPSSSGPLAPARERGVRETIQRLARARGGLRRPPPTRHGGDGPRSQRERVDEALDVSRGDGAEGDAEGALLGDDEDPLVLHPRRALERVVGKHGDEEAPLVARVAERPARRELVEGRDARAEQRE